MAESDDEKVVTCLLQPDPEGELKYWREEAKKHQDEIEILATALYIVFRRVDYSSGKCGRDSKVGEVLPMEMLDHIRETLVLYRREESWWKGKPMLSTAS